MEREGSTLEEKPEAGMLNRILGGQVRDKRGKYGKKNAGEKGRTWKERVEGCGKYA